MAHLHGVTQWLGLPVPHVPLHFLLASFTSGPDVCANLHDKGTQLLQDTHTNKVRGNKQDLTWVLVCPCGLQLVLVGSSLLLLSSTLHLSSLFLTHCLMNFKVQNQTQRQEPYFNYRV